MNTLAPRTTQSPRRNVRLVVSGSVEDAVSLRPALDPFQAVVAQDDTLHAGDRVGET
jgi:hypothetical protein